MPINRTRFDMIADAQGAPRDDLLRDLDQSATAYTALRLPAPVFSQPDNGAHEGGIIVGRVDSVVLENGRTRALGVYYDSDADQADKPRVWAAATEAVALTREGAIAPSVDPTALMVRPGPDGELALAFADFSGVTLVSMPAKTNTSVRLLDDEDDVDDVDEEDLEPDEDAPVPTEAEALAMAAEVADPVAEARLSALIATVTEAPPADAFARPDIGPGFDGFRIEGRRISGNLYPVGACHRTWRDRCVTAPASPSGYAMFRRYAMATDAGEIPVGRLTSGLGRVGNGCQCCDPLVIDDHACPNTLGLIAAMAHHDLMTTLADVNVGEHEGAIWVAGLLRDPLPAGAEAVLSRRVWSGDWRPAGDADELVEILALHHGEPGFTARAQHSRTRGVLIASTGPAPAPPVADGDAQAADLIARTIRAVRSADALEIMHTAVAEADQAAARTALARLEHA